MLNRKPIRLVWGNPAVPGGRWHLGLLNLKTIPQSPGIRHAPDPAQMEAYGRHVLHISFGGAGLWLLCIALLSYLLGAGVVLHRLKSGNRHARVGYFDLVLPHRWRDLERLRGAALIDQARELLAQNKSSEGFGLLRQGLARHPADFSARLDIARIYDASGLKPHAIKLLGAGLEFGYPGKEYLETFVALLSESDQPDLKSEVLSLAREKAAALPEAMRPVRDMPWLDEQLARALREAGRDAEAIAHLEKSLSARDPVVRRFVAAHFLAANRSSAAADVARRWAEDFPRDLEPLCVWAASLRAGGDLTGMEAILARLERLDPARPDALLYSVIQNHLAGRNAEAERKLDELIFRHGSTPGFYTTVCASFLGFAYEPGLERAEKEMRERGFSVRPALWARVKLAEQARDWNGLLLRLEELRNSSGPRFTAIEKLYLDTVEKLGLACLDGASGTQASLVEVVRRHPGTVTLYRTLIESLLHAGRPATAKEIFVLAQGPFPESRTLANLRPRIDAAVSSRSVATVSDRPVSTFATWEVFATAVGARVKDQHDEEALALFSEVRRARPAWFDESAARVDALELPLQARAGDPLRLRILVRSALARDPACGDALVTLAQKAWANGHKDNALSIVAEILRHTPKHPGARAQMNSWAPPEEETANASAPAPASL